MKKRTALNICMVLTIMMAAVFGMIMVGTTKDWWKHENKTESDYIISEKTGIVQIVRRGVGYEVSAGMTIMEDDQLYIGKSAALTVADADGTILMTDSDVEITVKKIDEDLSFEVLRGEVFVDARNRRQVNVLTGSSEISADEAVISVSLQPGASMIHVYSGEILLGNIGEEEGTGIVAGQAVTIVPGESEYDIVNFPITGLSDSQMSRLVQCGIDETFCVTESELRQVQMERQEELENVRQQLAAKDDGCDSLYCTMEIRCDTILANMENLIEEKEGYVPSDGIILERSAVTFQEGETVFDVLQKVCDRADIQLEYSYTPLYESYYIEGIQNLYEFDCGSQSGWVYQVNGWFPNYGCSSYEVKEGDVIAWYYTCNGLGADVGGENY